MTFHKKKTSSSFGGHFHVMLIFFQLRSFDDRIDVFWVWLISTMQECPVFRPSYDSFIFTMNDWKLENAFSPGLGSGGGLRGLAPGTGEISYRTRLRLRVLGTKIACT